MSFGDNPIDGNQPQFTFGEATEIAGLRRETLNNWHTRGVISLGTMNRATGGRRLYSIADLIKLKMIGQLSEMTSVPPSLAIAIADRAMARASALSRRNTAGELEDIKPEDREYLVAWVRDDGKPYTSIEKGADWLAKHSMPHPFIVVPIDDTIWRVWNAAVEVLEREHKAKSGGN